MCLCGTTLEFQACCEPLLQQKIMATHPESLMRSRYVAFILKNFDYLTETHDPQTRQHFDLKTNVEWANTVKFTGLEIIHSEEVGNKGLVEFKAHFQDLSTQESHVHHEISKFRKQGGIWYFREGKLKPQVQK